MPEILAAKVAGALLLLLLQLSFPVCQLPITQRKRFPFGGNKFGNWAVLSLQNPVHSNLECISSSYGRLGRTPNAQPPMILVESTMSAIKVRLRLQFTLNGLIGGTDRVILHLRTDNVQDNYECMPIDQFEHTLRYESCHYT